MRLPKRITGVMCALLIGGPCVADDEAKTATSQSVTEAIEAFNKQEAEFREKVMAAPAEKRRELAAEGPESAPVIDLAMALLKESPEDPGVPAAAAWLLSQRSPLVERAAVCGTLIKHHLGSPDLSQACMAAIFDSGEEAEQFLETVYAKADAPQARAAAAYVLSYKMRRDPKASPEKRVEYLRAAVKDAGDLEFRGRGIKAAAEGELFAAENLGIGKEAPEIEGEDVEGVAFKLSDYRGKVVVIDFWGDW